MIEKKNETPYKFITVLLIKYCVKKNTEKKINSVLLKK